MLNVLLTVDTEHWPGNQWPSRLVPRPYEDFARDYDRDILGRTATGDYGLPYLLNSLSRHDLKAIFFVEALHASAVCQEPLNRTVEMIRKAGQDIQLHVHTEWIAEPTSLAGLGPYRQNLRDFSEAGQTALIGHALENLQRAGAPGVVAVRAGNMGGNAVTWAAAKASGLAWDMSMDLSEGRAVQALVHDHAQQFDAATACPTIPLSCVEDFPGHFRPAQLTALSFREMEHALFVAAEESFGYFVILLHSFELVSKSSDPSRPIRPHCVNIERWDRLCDLLNRRQDIFRTIASPDLLGKSMCQSPARYMKTRPLHTLARYAEQIQSRFT